MTTSIQSLSTDQIQALTPGQIPLILGADGVTPVGTGMSGNWVGVDPSDARLVAYQNSLIQAQMLLAATEAIQNMLDALAVSWGYTDITSAATFLNSVVPQFKAEAIALTNWRDNVWAQAGAIQALPQAQQPNTIASLLALLPAAPSKPTV
jgi:hypothetical protein